MTKGIKITSDSQVIALDDWRKDPDYIDNVLSGYSLRLPQFWDYQIFRLSVFIVDIYEENHEYNHLATNVFQKLYSPYGESDQIIKGFMFICNEDDDKAIDFTLDDYNYILPKLKRNIKYLKREPFNIKSWIDIMREES